MRTNWRCCVVAAALAFVSAGTGILVAQHHDVAVRIAIPGELPQTAFRRWPFPKFVFPPCSAFWLPPLCTPGGGTPS